MSVSGACQKLKKPFSTAKSVTFRNCTLDGQFKQLNKWFPRMESLEFDDTKTHPDCIEKNFPNLRLLMVNSRQFSTECVVSAIRLNPQLVSLELNVDGLMQILRGIQNLLNLTRIALSADSVLPIIGNCESLKTFSFEVDDKYRFDRHRLEECLSNEWKFEWIGYSEAKLERKN